MPENADVHGAKMDLFTGLVAVMLLVTMPRVFGHAHISALDTAISCINLIVIVEFFSVVEKKSIYCGWDLCLVLPLAQR